MLAAMRFRFLFTFLLVFVLASWLPSVAQFQGVPPGQFQGVPTIPFQGVPAASFGVHSYGSPAAGAAFPGCCANFFLPSGFSPLVPVPSLGQGHHRHRHHKDDALGVVAEPVYIPYAVPYGADADDDTADNDNQDSAEPAGYWHSRSCTGNRSTEVADTRSSCSGANERGTRG